MKQLLFAILIGILFTGCNMDNKKFNLKTIKLNSYRGINLPAQNLSFRIVQGTDSLTVLAETGAYPSKLPLPAALGIMPSLSSKLYKESYLIQLIGDSTGVIGSCRIDMDKYKIVFPIEMEVENEDMNISISGSWH